MDHHLVLDPNWGILAEDDGLPNPRMVRKVRQGSGMVVARVIATTRDLNSMMANPHVLTAEIYRHSGWERVGEFASADLALRAIVERRRKD